ncbi:group II intron reverse transcriptase/maturase [Streptomyces sp. NBC_00371]|uniref:group II intron reverse transcriptase/maturase n=1 Tax=unclassified Streptomyces TaxID=2593676 RepID=UPI002E2653C6|nr:MULTISPECIES: group II intron reverse transcriptase/maturase [unclassified Streptomyces]
MNQTSGSKSFEISKHLVFEAYLRVKANKGAAGVDGESIEQFEVDLKGNLYKLWNRMSSGCYFPPPVKMVEIDKPGGRGVRVLGVPTVADRIAQTVVAMVLEPLVEPVFHPDSYGYRPRRSALDAVAACRERCWKTDWVIDMDIRGFFDNLDHDLVLRAVGHHTDQRWVLLYVERWLKAPLQRRDGSLQARDRGSPQGSAVSPVLSNLFMHYAFDMWMARQYPGVHFERYCDDVVVHCRNEAQAHQVRQAIGGRLAECGGLELHPDKTRIVYCKDRNRRGSAEHTSFTFLGYGFRVRRLRTKRGDYFFGFNPAVSDDAAKQIRMQIRHWRLHLRSRACASSRVRPTGVRMPRVGVDDRADTESVIIQVSKPSDQEGSRVRCLIFPDPCRVGQVGSAQPGRRG